MKHPIVVVGIICFALTSASGGEAFVALPDASAVSPLCIQGTREVGRGVRPTVDGAAVPIVALGAGSWYADVPLAHGADNRVRVRHDGASVVRAVRWEPTAVVGDAQRVLRRGDSLLLSGPAGGVLRTRLECGAGTDLAIPGDGLVALPFTEVGTHVVEAWSPANEQIGVLRVTAIAVDLDGPIAGQVGYARDKGVDIRGGTLADVAFAGGDALLSAEAYQPTAYGARLRLTPHGRGLPVLVARLAGGDGAILATQEIDEFTLESQALDTMVVDSETRIGRATLIMRPFIPDLEARFAMFAHRSTFLGGANELTVATSDLRREPDPATGERIARILVDIESPQDEDRYCFAFVIDQHSNHGTPASETKPVNGSLCTFTVKRLCRYDGDPPAVMKVTAAATNKDQPHHNPGPKHHQLAIVKSKATAAPDTFECKQAGTVDWDPTVTLNGATPGCYDVTIDGTPFTEKLVVARVDSIAVAQTGGKVNAYGFTFGVKITVSGPCLECLEITQLIQASATQSDYDGTAYTIQQIIANYPTTDPVVLNSPQFTTDTGWAWQTLGATCADKSKDKRDNQVSNITNRRIMVDGKRRTEIQRATRTRNFNVQVRLEGQAQIRAQHAWGYGWNNDNAAWPGHTSARSDLGTGTITNVVGITGF